MSGPELITLGCRLNMAESEAMRRLAAGADDLIIVNSCAVTNEAVRRTRQEIRKAKRARPEARVIVTGCAAQVEPEAFAAMVEVDRVVGNLEKLRPDSFIPLPASGPVPDSTTTNPVRAELVEALPFSSSRAEIEEEGRTGLRQAQPERSGGFEGTSSFLAAPRADIRVSDNFAVRDYAPHLAPAFSERERAFLEVQNGCDHRCTFCIIPYGRGNSRSVPAGLVVDRVKALVDEGVAEVVLTGVDVTSYGPDLPGRPSFGALVERILRHVPDLQRLRLSSLDCIEIDERLFDVITGEARFMPHLHMSFQAGDDMVLKRMKRRHSRAQAVETVKRLKAKRPEIAIGADLIAGFPTETDEMHLNSLRLVDECDIVMAHVFPYSPKAGTPAARMPQVDPKVARGRAKALREASAVRRTAWLQGLVGTRQRVLIEGSGMSGHAENFAPVTLRPQGMNEVGKVVEVVIAGVEGETLIGEAL